MMDLTIIPITSSRIARAYAFAQQAFTGIPYQTFLDKHVLRIKGKLYAPKDFVHRISRAPTQYDVGALVYELALRNGMSKDKASHEEHMFLERVTHHFAYGKEPEDGGDIANAAFSEYIERLTYVHVTKRHSDLRPFLA